MLNSFFKTIPIKFSSISQQEFLLNRKILFTSLVKSIYVQNATKFSVNQVQFIDKQFKDVGGKKQNSIILFGNEVNSTVITIN